MRKGIIVEVSAADRARLEAVVADRNSPQKHVWRARIVLLTADGHGTVEIMRRAGHEQGRGLALAGAVHDRGGRRAAAGQDPAVAHPAAGRRGGGPRGRR